jgi:hypothetical protein
MLASQLLDHSSGPVAAAVIDNQNFVILRKLRKGSLGLGDRAGYPIDFIEGWDYE